MKAILVIDMPDCCNNCPCYDGMEDRSCCNVLNEDMRFASYGRLGNCPLRPMLEKLQFQEPFNDDYTVSWASRLGFVDGWNACLDSIIGENNESNYRY